MKKLFAAIILAPTICLSIPSFAAEAECPTAGSFTSSINLTDPGMVPKSMPHYQEHAGKQNPYFIEGENRCVVLAVSPTASDRHLPGVDARVYMTLVVPACTEDESRTDIIAAAQAILDQKPANPKSGPIAYHEEWSAGSHAYEMCSYTGTTGGDEDGMSVGSSLAELE